MEYLKVRGKSVTGGELTVQGAKNSALPVLSACVLIKGECIIHNVPRLDDVDVTLEILKHLGARVKREGSTVSVNCSEITSSEIPLALMTRIRSSIMFLGALLSRNKRAVAYLPGGCRIGLRPLNLHINGLEELGYSFSFDNERIICEAKKLGAETVNLEYPSVGATENIILSSVFISGTTKIRGAAREPEIEDLCDFLNGAGARIRGAGTSFIEIDGVKALHPIEHTVIPDRIAAASYMALSAATGREMRLQNIDIVHLKSLYPIFSQSGCKLYLGHNSLRIKPPKRLRKVKDIVTLPYPYFPTDCQAPIMAMLTIARGKSEITETVFENRFMHVKELKKFGADIETVNNTAIIRGRKSLHSSYARCTDLRGGMAVLIEALLVDGTSYIENVSHIDRGYERIEETLSLVGADITRICDEKEGQ